MKLHIGGTVSKEGWTNLNIQEGESVDLVGSCTNLARFESGTCSDIYASHVLEHLSAAELLETLSECHRMLAPGGKMYASVPDLAVLSRLVTDPQLNATQRWHVQRMIFGGQTDAYDFHKVGLTWEFLLSFAQQAGFSGAQRVSSFGLFEDTSELVCYGVPISLNAELDA